jgi:hypothetical protein
VVLLGVLVPRLALHARQPAPVAPTYHVTVHQPGPGSPSGEVAWGTINGKRWEIRVVVQQGLSAGCAVFGRELECGPSVTSAAAQQVSFISATSGSVQFQLAAVGAGVTKVAVTLGNGTELSLRPTALDGKRWVAFAAPTRLPVSQATSFAGHSELGYAIPYNGASAADFVDWLHPGQRGAARASYRIGSGTVGGERWSSTAHVGPWGVCVDSVGAGTWCAPSASDIQPNGAATSYLTCSPGTQAAWFTAAAKSTVSAVRFSLSDGSSLTVRAIRIADGGRAYVFAVPNGVQLRSWTALDAAGKQIATGPGWRCG